MDNPSFNHQATIIYYNARERFVKSFLFCRLLAMRHYNLVQNNMARGNYCHSLAAPALNPQNFLSSCNIGKSRQDDLDVGRIGVATFIALCIFVCFCLLIEGRLFENKQIWLIFNQKQSKV